MSRNGKIILAIVAVVLVLCIGAVAVGALFFARTSSSISQVVQLAEELPAQEVNTPDSESVGELANSIVDFDLPEGYAPEASVNLLGFKVATFSPGDGKSHLYLMQFPPSAEVNREAMEKQLLQALRSSGQSWDADEMHQVGEIVKTIRDEEVTFTISEGTDNEGATFRAVVGVFQGKSGPALLMFAEPVEKWDEARVGALLDSLK